MEIITGHACSAADEIDGARPRLWRPWLGDRVQTPPSAEPAVTPLPPIAFRIKLAADLISTRPDASRSVCSTSTTTGPRSALMFIRTTIGLPPELSCGSSEGDPSDGLRGLLYGNIVRGEPLD